MFSKFIKLFSIIAALCLTLPVVAATIYQCGGADTVKIISYGKCEEKIIHEAPSFRGSMISGKPLVQNFYDGKSCLEKNIAISYGDKNGWNMWYQGGEHVSCLYTVNGETLDLMTKEVPENCKFQDKSGLVSGYTCRGHDCKLECD